jgi:hypothetical protein
MAEVVLACMVVAVNETFVLAQAAWGAVAAVPTTHPFLMEGHTPGMVALAVAVVLLTATIVTAEMAALAVVVETLMVVIGRILELITTAALVAALLF